MEEIIKSYIKKSPNSALMIDGKWGTGKTHYVKHDLKLLIKECNKKMLYTSANGITSFSEITSQILLEQYNINKSVGQTIRIAYEIAKIGIDNTEKFKFSSYFIKTFEKFYKTEDSIKFNDKVIIIDDVERIDFKKFSIEDFFGKLNALLTEQDKISVIICCNEDELKARIKDSNDKSIYETIKEKSIWRTIKFNIKIQSITQKILNETNPTTGQKIINQNTEFILEIIKLSGESNVRTILFYFETLNDIISKIPENINDENIKTIILFTFIVCKEYKDGKISNHEKDTAPSYLLHFGTLELLDKISNTNNSNQDKENRLLRYESLINEYDTYYRYIKSIFIYICQGILDKEKLKNDINTINKSIVSIKDCTKELNKIINFVKLDDNEFNLTFDKIINHFRNGEYNNTTDFIRFIDISIYFIENEISISIQSVLELQIFILECIQKTSFYELSISTELEERFDKIIKKNPELIEIKNILHQKQIEGINQLINVEKEMLYKDLLIDIENFNDIQFDRLFTQRSISTMPKLIEKYSVDNIFANKFNSKLKNEWKLRNYNNGPFVKIENLLTFSTLCKNKTPNRSMFTNFNLKKLDRILEDYRKS